MKMFNQLAKKKKRKTLQFLLSCIKTKVLIKFPKKKKIFFSFLLKIGLALKGLISVYEKNHQSRHISDGKVFVITGTAYYC